MWQASIDPLMESYVSLANQIRGFLFEFGIVIPQGIRHIERCLPSILEDAENELAVGFRQLLARLMEAGPPCSRAWSCLHI
jgi:hypothetical protein